MWNGGMGRGLRGRKGGKEGARGEGEWHGKISYLLAAGDTVGWAVVLSLCLWVRGRRGDGGQGVCVTWWRVQETV
jgi:hypothetical protein